MIRTGASRMILAAGTTCDLWSPRYSVESGGQVVDYDPANAGVACRGSNPTGSEGVEAGGVRANQSRLLYIEGETEIEPDWHVMYAGKCWNVEGVQRFGSDESDPDYKRLDLRRVEGVHVWP